MNKLNYASLEASKRLIDAGIRLDTDSYWATYLEEVLQSIKDAGKVLPSPYLVNKDSIHNKDLLRECKNYIPAPTMAEIWRELPEGTISMKANDRLYFSSGDKGAIHSTNPTDALVNLLILIRKDERKEM
jgi:hypothetical protein